MDYLINIQTSKIVDSVIRFLFDKDPEYRCDDYMNYQTSRCVASVLNFVFREEPTLLKNSTQVKELDREKNSTQVKELDRKNSTKVKELDRVKKPKNLKCAKQLKYNLSENSKDRPTFYTRSGQSIKAAGILCYVYDDRKKKKIWLLRENNGYLTNTGGKTDSVDRNPLETAIRKTVEKTNGHLFSSYHDKRKCFETLWKSLNKQKNKIIYIKESNYLLFIFKLDFYAKIKSLKRFETSIEEKDDKNNSYNWYEKIPTERLHPRLINISRFFY